MPSVPGPRILTNNGEDDRAQKHPDDLYAEKELAVMSDAADRTGIDITNVTATVHLPLKHATGFQSDSVGGITVEPTTGLFTISKAGKYLVSYEGWTKGTNSKYYQLSVGKNGVEEAASLRQFTEPAAAILRATSLKHYVDCVPGDTLSLRVDVQSDTEVVTFDGFTVLVELVESQG